MSNFFKSLVFSLWSLVKIKFHGLWSMDYGLFTIYFLLFLTSCNPGILEYSNTNPHLNIHPNNKSIIWVQAANQVDSRIAADRFVRMSPQPSIQGYLYTQPERLMMDNYPRYKEKLTGEGYTQMIIMRLLDSTEYANKEAMGKTKLEGDFLSDYVKYIDPFAFNPVYQFQPDPFSIETRMYNLSDGTLQHIHVTRLLKGPPTLSQFDLNAKAIIGKLNKTGG